MAELTRVRYAGKDFKSAYDELVQRAQAEFGSDFNDFYASGVGGMLLDLLAHAVDSLSFYADRQATDSYLATASLRRAVSRLTRQLGYKMRGAIAATVDLTVTLVDGPYAFDVTLPKGFQFRGPSGLVFESTQAVTYSAGQTQKTVSAREGGTKVEVFASDGSVNQVFNLAQVQSGKYVAQGSVLVYVGGVPWVESEFLTYDSTNQYEVGLNDEPPSVRFGDGVAGNVPPRGSEVRVVYVVNSGLAGQAPSNSVTDVVSALVVDSQRIDLSVTNPRAASGAAEPESLDSARALAPITFKARDVAVVESDFLALSNTFADPLFGAVAKSRAVVVRSAESDTLLRVLLAQVASAASASVPAVTAGTADIKAKADDELVQAATLTSTAASLAGAASSSATSASTADGLQDSIVAYGESIDAHKDVVLARTSSSRAEASSSDASAALVETYLNDVVAAVAVINANPTLQVNNATIQAELNTILARAASAKTEKSNINARNALITSQQYAVDAEVNAVSSTDVAGLQADAVSTKSELTNVSAQAASVTSGAVAVGVAAVAVAADANAQKVSADAVLAAVVDPTVTLGSLSDQIFQHVDGLLSDNCKANLVQVPILTRDVNGFLQAPSVALVNAVQAYLESRKEPTVTLEVLDGSPSLVLVDVSVKVGVLAGYVPAEVLSNVSSALDALLKAREFGQALRLSEPSTGDGLYDVVAGVAGVRYANVEVAGVRDYQGSPLSGKITPEGDVVVANSEVVTKGNTSVVAA